MAGKIVHVEVVGKDGAALQRFYSDVFGWELDTNNPAGYGMLRQGDLSAGIGPTPDGAAGHVTFYVHTDDPAATLRRAEESLPITTRSAPTCSTRKRSCGSPHVMQS
jgi:uncharacterized protein